MMDNDEDSDKSKYKNWVRGAKGLEYFKQGLQTFTGDTVLRHRDQTVQRLANTSSPGSPIQCNQCTLQNLLPEHVVLNKLCNKSTCIQQNSANCFGSKPAGRRKCPNGICSKLYDAIVHSHRFKDPLWKYTDPSTWCSDPSGWSFAKCFQTTPNPGTSSAKTDSAGLLNIILTDVVFQNEVACNLASEHNVFSRAREIQNDILHCPKMELEDTILQNYVDTFIDVLQDPKCLIHDQRVKDSLQYLEQVLIANSMDIDETVRICRLIWSHAGRKRTRYVFSWRESNIFLQLKTDQITISPKVEIKLIQARKDALAALENLEEKEREVIINIEESQAVAEMEGGKSTALERINDSDIQNWIQQAESRIQQLERQLNQPIETILYSRDKVPSSRYTPSPSGDNAIEDDDTDTKKTKAVLDKAWGKLIDYLNPDPILEYAFQYDLFGYRQTENIKEEKLTKEKNRKMLEEVRTRGKTGYEKLKECLKTTNQLKLFELLKCIERGEDTSILLKQIHEEAIHDLPQRLKELQDGLISFYRRQHSKFTLSPLVKEDTPFLEYYAMPTLTLIERAPGNGNEKETLIESLRNVFYKERKLCNEIYLTADAGLGKTTFSKRLALAWCHAKEPVAKDGRYFLEKEITTMNGFRFLFLLLLRDSSGKCNIDDMILNEIVSQLGHDYTLKDLENILSKETCLVILDGLDEWTHPSQPCGRGESNIPHRRARDSTVVLTTTRPWKLSCLTSSDIDQKLEIRGLNHKSANALKRSIISHLSGMEDETILEQNVQDFSRALKKKQISDMEAVPLLLMYLLYLWHYGIELGQCQCDLYSQIIELMLSRTVQNNKDTSSQTEPTQGDIPKCFSIQTCCKQFYTHLTALGQLAFETLFNETRKEHTFVFGRSKAEQYLDKECLTFCFNTGIITQGKVQGNPLIQESKVSFAHKTVQEYLAALYIVLRSTPDQTSVSETVLSRFKCVKDILEMSKVLIFLSGFNANVLSLISREMMKIINEDEITREYRSSVDVYSKPLKQFQDMCVSCCKELPDENEVSLCLQDVFIGGSCLQAQYRQQLKQVTTRNKQNIRSLYIGMCNMKSSPYRSAREVIEYYGLGDLEKLEKLDCVGECDRHDILPLLNRSVKSLSLSCCYSIWSHLLYEKVASLQQLEAIRINAFKMSHEQLTLLFDYISHRHCMRQIELGSLRCSNHVESCTDNEDSITEDSCTGGSVDLSQHSDLRTLTLDNIPVKQLHINMAAIEECSLERLSNPDFVLRFVNCVPTDSRVKTFVCDRLNSSDAVDACLHTLPQLWQVEYVKLFNINLGIGAADLSPQMKNIEHVNLFRVTMSAQAVRGLATLVLTLPQTVAVEMLLCIVTPREEFEIVKAEMRNSPRIRLLRDCEGWCVFVKHKQ